MTVGGDVGTAIIAAITVTIVTDTTVIGNVNIVADTVTTAVDTIIVATDTSTAITANLAAHCCGVSDDVASKA